MLRLLFLGTCLIAALTGTPLRQVEAAEDLARSLAQWAGEHVFEVVDGGVGDDAGDTVLNHGSDDFLALPALSSTLSAGWFVPPAPAPTGAALERRSRIDQVPTAAPGRRWAWLQRFLF